MVFWFPVLKDSCQTCKKTQVKYQELMHHPSFANSNLSDPTKDSPSHSLAGQQFLLYPQSSDHKEGEMRYKADESGQPCSVLISSTNCFILDLLPILIHVSFRLS